MARARTLPSLPTLNELYRPFVVFPVVTEANAALENERLEKRSWLLKQLEKLKSDSKEESKSDNKDAKDGKDGKSSDAKPPEAKPEEPKSK